MSKKVTMELKELDDIAGNTAYIERDHETLNRDIQTLKSIAAKKNEQA